MLDGLNVVTANRIAQAVHDVATQQTPPGFDGQPSRYSTMALTADLRKDIAIALSLTETELRSARLHVFQAGDYILPVRGAAGLPGVSTGHVYLLPVTRSATDGVTIVLASGVARVVDASRAGSTITAETWWWVSPVNDPPRIAIVLPRDA